jgi:hypothetical protein
MILPIIKELSMLCRVPKLGSEQRDKAYDLMRRLREHGFTNHELFVMVRGKISEISIKRNTAGVEVRDTKEHDEIIEQIADFADQGYEVGDIEDYKTSKAVLEKVNLTFSGCAKFAEDLLLLGVDTPGLLRLSDELTSENLTAKSIRKNIDLNEELSKKKITVEIQQEIRDAANSYGNPVNILKIVNASGGLHIVVSEIVKAKDELAQAKVEKDQVQREKERLENDSVGFKSYVDVAKLLVTKYGFDLSSVNELMSLAGKHGTPVGVIQAVNSYNEFSELQAKLREAQTKLHITEVDLANKETVLKGKEENIAKANQLLGEIRANHAQSFRLQIVSDLLTRPREVMAPMREVAGICLALLLGVRDYSESHKEESERFRGKAGVKLNWIIQDLQEYTR